MLHNANVSQISGSVLLFSFAPTLCPENPTSGGSFTTSFIKSAQYELHSLTSIAA